MSWSTIFLLFAAGVGAGLSGSIAGLASLFSFPALLAIGLPPVIANVTNTVALVFSGVGSVAGSRLELRGYDLRRLSTLFIFSAVGGLSGGLLLILSPAGAFERVVPFLIALASIGVLLPRRAPSLDDGEPRRPRWLTPAILGVGVYSGYFGAAAGTLLLALLLMATAEALAVCNAVKNVLLGLSNGVSAILFAITAHVAWAAVLPLALGLLAGGFAGATVVRHAPVRPLRWLIAIAGLGLAGHLAIQEYA